MSGIARSAAHWIARHAWLTLAMVAAVVLPLIALGGGVRPDNSLEVWFVEGDPALTAYRTFLEDFGSDDAVMVAFDGDTTAAGRERQRELARSLRAIDGVGRTVAAADLPPNAARATGLTSADGGATAVVAWLDPGPAIEAQRGRIVAEIDSAAGAVIGPGAYHLAGTSVLYEGLNQATIADTGVFLALAVGVMILILTLALRRARAVAIVLIPPLLASGASMGIVALSGRPLTLVGSALPTLVLVIALADAIHVLLHYWRMRGEHPPADVATRRAQAADAVAWSAIPCLFTSLTTAAGFAALGFSRIAVVRDFGWLAAAGMLLAWVVTLPLLAVALTRWDVAPPVPRSRRVPALDAIAGAIAARLPARRTVILVASALVMIVMGAGIRRVRVDTHTIGLLSEKHVVRRDSDWIERNLGAYTPLEFELSAPDGVRDSTFLARLADWRRRMESVAGVARTITAVAPATDGADNAYARADGRALRVTAHVPMATAREFARIARAGEREGAAVFGDTSSVRAAGYLPLYVRIIEYVVESTIVGLGLAFVLVFVLVAILVRSGRAVALAIPANLLPIAVVFGVMGWLGVALDIATATVGAIVLGIVVDDTIHFLVHHRDLRAGGSSPTEAAVRAIRNAGPSMILTSLVLAGGFAVMLAAGTKSIVYFGLVASVAIVTALAADLLFLPALLIWRQPLSVGGIESRQRSGASADA